MEGTMISIKIPKADASVDVDWEALPDNVKMYVVEQGLSKLLQAATAKVKKGETDAAGKAMALVEKRIESLKAGKVTVRASKADGKTPGVVMTEARRLAKTIIKAALKAQGRKVASVPAAKLTEASNKYLSEHPELVVQAQANVTANAALAETATVHNVEAFPKAADRKATKRKPSAPQATVVAAKTRPPVQPQHTRR